MRLSILYLADWAIIAISFFNTIALLWLGLTVLLNAEPRRWSTWAAGGGMVLGGLFFAGHTSVVGRVIGTFHTEMEIWWRLGWLPFVAGPYAWYLVMAAYTGVLGVTRHRIWLGVVSVLGAVALALLAFANPLPTYGQVLQQEPSAVFAIAGIPVVALVYPVYSVLCIVLAISALRHPAASDRFMGDLARERARPWLIAASLVLLLVGLIVGGAAALFLSLVRRGQLPGLSLESLEFIIQFDLLISGLIAVSVVLIGKAIVSYEIFTGKALPRGGLFRHWRNSLVLAAGYGTLVGGSLALPIDFDPIYRLMLATILMTLFYALLSWRTYAERERGIERLRPFVASQRLYERMLRPAAPPEIDIIAPFRALCDDLLGARVAYLVALGPMGPLMNQLALAADEINDQVPVSTLALASLTERLRSSQAMCVPLDPDQYGGAVWAVPLWSERGLIGVLLLGEKRDAGLYTQEEIEVARAGGERLIDTGASAELVRRLMSLQRQRLAESQVVDRRTRRVLHDDVLPQLHAALLRMQTIDPVLPDREADPQAAERRAAISEVMEQLVDTHRQIANLLHDLPATAAPEVARLGLIGALQRATEGELGSAFDGVQWHIDQSAVQAAQNLPALGAEVLFYAAREAIRNAARHGRGKILDRQLHLNVVVARRGDEITTPRVPSLEILVEDDGVGIGASEAPIKSGHGLDLHTTMLAVVGGTLTTASGPEGTRVALAMPLA